MTSSDEENQLSETSTVGQSPPTNTAAAYKPPPPIPHGYHALAHFMTDKPTMAMYKRFGVLNALSLLFYQADLKKLELELLDQMKSDYHEQDPVKRRFNTDWSSVSATDAQRKIMNEIREIMERYSKQSTDNLPRIVKFLDKQFLLQQQISKLKTPTIPDAKYLRSWMLDDAMGSIKLEGPDCEVWRQTALSEYVAIDSNRSDDALTRWMNDFVLGPFHEYIGQHLPQV